MGAQGAEFMVHYDESVPDAYTGHLSEVNATNSVVASEDIYNTNGMLLVKQGQAIEPKVAARLLQHRLVRPMEDQVSLENMVTAAGLYRHILSLIDEYDDFRALARWVQAERVLQQGCAFVMRFPILQQKITVFAERMPEEYRKGLFCAWLATALGSSLGFSEQDRQHLFAAALLHDIGMLHIDPDIVNREGELSAEEWRSLQAHTVIGQKILDGLGELPRDVARAVLDHHERCDGTGYPRQLFADQLTEVSQIIALTDTLYSVRMREKDQGRRSLRDLVPVLQMNEYIFLRRPLNALMVMIRQADIDRRPPVDDGQLEEIVDALVHDFDVLAQWLKSTATIKPYLDADASHYRVRVVCYSIEHLWQLVITSGLITAGLRRWVLHVRENRLRECYEELDELRLMQKELKWQARRFVRQLELLAGEPDALTPEAQESVSKAVVSVKQVASGDQPPQGDEAPSFDSYAFILQQMQTG